MKKIVIALLVLLSIIGGIFGISKVKEAAEEQVKPGEVMCLYGCPSVKKRKFIRIK